MPSYTHKMPICALICAAIFTPCAVELTAAADDFISANQSLAQAESDVVGEPSQLVSLLPVIAADTDDEGKTLEKAAEQEQAEPKSGRSPEAEEEAEGEQKGPAEQESKEKEAAEKKAAEKKAAEKKAAEKKAAEKKAAEKKAAEKKAAEMKKE